MNFTKHAEESSGDLERESGNLDANYTKNFRAETELSIAVSWKDRGAFNPEIYVLLTRSSYAHLTCKDCKSFETT